MRHTDFDGFNCSVARALEQVGDPWTLLIVRDAQLGDTRFDEFRTSLGISRNTLSARLRRLVDDGILEAADGGGYRLTRKGEDLWEVVTLLMQWGDRWATPPGREPVRVRHVACDHVATAELTCSSCGGRLDRADLRMELGPGAADGPGYPARLDRA